MDDKAFQSSVEQALHILGHYGYAVTDPDTARTLNGWGCTVRPTVGGWCIVEFAPAVDDDG